MPAHSKAQQHLMMAALYHPSFPLARKVAGSMTSQQLRDFAHVPKDAPMRVKPKKAKRR